MIFFDESAEGYDNWYQSPLGRFADEVETRLAFNLFMPSMPKKGMKVLDAGCGTGNFSIKLAEMGVYVTGIDVSDKMLSIAREKAAHKELEIRFEKMNIYDLCYSENYFDGVFSMAVFEFVEQPEKAFQEMMRVLKPGGLLLIGTINKDSPWGLSYEEQASRNPNSIFRFADFKTQEVLENLDRKNFVAIHHCLFIPPDVAMDRVNWKEENRLSKIEKGGFIIALWRKPL